MAACRAVMDLVWLRKLFYVFSKDGCKQNVLSIHNSDGVLQCIKKPEYHKKNKHIDEDV